ncbi:MAG: RNA-binding S4 domain-containing protein [Alphaproteobacteria bacterium]|nr:MAG: RNA-binding S4 domain-containing protein [Alphaproteobacteria bacterium]
MRLDKWLWQARFFKSRALSAGIIGKGRVRLNGQRVTKPATQVRPGDVLTFPQGRTIRVVRLLALGVRRGPAQEARALYHDLSEPGTEGSAEPGRPAPPDRDAAP